MARPKFVYQYTFFEKKVRSVLNWLDNIIDILDDKKGGNGTNTTNHLSRN